MYDYLQGEIVSVAEGRVVLDVHGVGYHLFVSGVTLEALPSRGQVRLFTALRVREEVPVLYGFHSPDEREIFFKLCNVAGVGPVTAIAILSGLPLEQFREAVVSEQPKLLQRVKGVGRKTAERVVLELKEIFQAGFGSGVRCVPPGDALDRPAEDAVKALVAIGTAPEAAEEDVRRAQRGLPAGATAEELVREAARLRARR